MKHRDILFLCQFFYPEYNSSATLPFDTAKYLAAQGYHVDALVGYPKEYSEGTAVPLCETVEGVCIRRVRYLQFKRSVKLLRLLNYLSFTFHMLLHTPLLKHYHCVFVYSNPPILPVVPLLACLLYGTRFVFIAYDVYPEVAYASGSLHSGDLISRTMVKLNRALCLRADAVVALTDEMRSFLLHARPELEEARVVTIPNWAHESAPVFEQPTPSRFGFEDGAFVVSYFGNMGVCQEMDTLLRAAELLRNNSRIRFMIAGFGRQKEAIQKQIVEKSLDNVRLTDYLTGVAFLDALSASSCFVVTLQRGLRGTCAPSKYYSYLQGGRPILSITEPDSYLVVEIRNEHLGYCLEIGDALGLCDAILQLAAQPAGCQEMGERAAAFYRNHYAYELAMEKYLLLTKRILQSENM